MNTLTPIPTRYGGVTFRSKSEAMFAAFIAAQDRCGELWVEYEPSRLKVASGYVIDFLLFNPSRCWDVRYTAIEYKPADASDSYKSKLANIFDIYREKCGHTLDCYLVSGSVYEENLEILFYAGADVGFISTNSDFENGSWGHSIEDGYCFAKKIRFDIKGNEDNYATTMCNQRISFQCNSSGREVGFFVSQGEHFRFDRLQRCYKAIKAYSWLSASLIREIGDHKGTLEVTWEQEPSSDSKWFVEYAWDSLGEHEVIHRVITRY